MVVCEQFDNGLRLLTEPVPGARSVSFGVWLTRGSRHERAAHSGIAHLVEHMLFKGTATRSARDIAQEIDSIGGQIDAFTAKECASYYVKVLDEHLPRAVDVLADMLLHPAFDADELARWKRKDPIDRVWKYLAAAGAPYAGDREAWEAEVEAEVEDVFAAAAAHPPPDPAAIYEHVFAAPPPTLARQRAAHPRQA